MKLIFIRKYFISLLLGICLFGCTKDSSVTEIKYEVTPLSNTTIWTAVYINELGNIITTDNKTGSWEYSFKDTHDLCCLSLAVLPECLCSDEDIEMTIYVNGKAVRSGLYSDYTGGLYWTF